jgi:hypothetical protein
MMVHFEGICPSQSDFMQATTLDTGRVAFSDGALHATNEPARCSYVADEGPETLASLHSSPSKQENVQIRLDGSHVTPGGSSNTRQYQQIIPIASFRSSLFSNLKCDPKF